MAAMRSSRDGRRKKIFLEADWLCPANGGSRVQRSTTALLVRQCNGHQGNAKKKGQGKQNTEKKHGCGFCGCCRDRSPVRRQCWWSQQTGNFSALSTSTCICVLRLLERLTASEDERHLTIPTEQHGNGERLALEGW